MEPSNHVLWSAIGLFAGLLVVFHLFVFLWKPDGRFLKRADYYWLGFTALSLISAASAQRQFIAENELQTSRLRVAGSLTDLRSFARAGQQYVCNTAWQAPTIPDPTAQQRYESRGAACTWFSGLAKQAARPEISLDATIGLLGQPRPPDVPASWNDETLAGVVTQAQRVAAEYKQFTADSQKNELEKGMILMFPYLLAIALALRITKVTGELRL